MIKALKPSCCFDVKDYQSLLVTVICFSQSKGENGLSFTSSIICSSNANPINIGWGNPRAFRRFSNLLIKQSK
jgi:hypothetical protein